MTRLAGALVALALCALAQERTAREVYADAQRLHDRGEFEAAVDAFAEAARIAEANEEGAKERSGFEAGLALALIAVRRTEGAESHLRKAVELASEASPALDETLAFLRSSLAALEAESGKLDQAELDACTALEAVQGSAPAIEVQCLVTLARISFLRRQYRVAYSLLHVAATRAREAQLPRRDVIYVWRAVARLHVEVGAYSHAEEALEQIRADHEAGGPTPGAGLEWARLLAEVRIAQRSFADAERIANSALERAAGAPNVRIEIASVMICVAKVALEEGKLERAARQLAHAEPALRSPGPDTRPHLASLLETRAQVRRRRGDAAGARTDLEEALALRMQDGEGGLAAARTLLALAALESDDGAHAKAIDCAGRATRIFFHGMGPSGAESQDACEAYRTLSKLAQEKGLKDLPPLRGMRLGEALEPDAAATDAKVLELLAQAKALDSKGHSPGVLALADEALALRPGEARVHWARCLALDPMKRSEDAAAAADAAISSSLYPASMFGWRSYLNLMLRRHDRAIVDATYAILLGDKDPAHLRTRGTARCAIGPSELGLRSLDAAVAAGLDDAPIQYIRGIALWYLDRFDDAAAAFRVAAAGGYRRSDACAKLARYEHRRGNAEDALALATESIEARKEEHDRSAYGVRGFIRFDRGEWKAALADFEMWGGDAPSVYGRVLQWLCHARIGDSGAATEELRAALGQGTDREDVRCVARAILGDREFADNVRASGCTAQFLLGAWQEVLGDPAKAKTYYERAVATDRDDLLDFHSAKAALARLSAAK